MDELGGNEWSWEENKLFEVALAVIDEDTPDRWEEVAVMVGGKRSADDVHTHYVVLLQDLECIESGKLDHTLLLDEYADISTESSCCTDEEDHNFLVRLNLVDD